MKKKRTVQARSTDPLDYPSSMSGYERDSLVAEAILAAEKKNGQIRPKVPGDRNANLAKLGGG
jgi:hypothetical protein